MGRRMGPRRSNWTEQSPGTKGWCRCVVEHFLSQLFGSCSQEVEQSCVWCPQGSSHTAKQTGMELLIPWTPPSSYCWQGLPFHSQGPCPAVWALLRSHFPRPHPGWGSAGCCGSKPWEPNKISFRWAPFLCLWRSTRNTTRNSALFQDFVPVLTFLQQAGDAQLWQSASPWRGLVCYFEKWKYGSTQRVPHFFWDECLI